MKIFTIAIISKPQHRWEQPVEIHRYTMSEINSLWPADVVAKLMLSGKAQSGTTRDGFPIMLVNAELAAFAFAQLDHVLDPL